MGRGKSGRGASHLPVLVDLRLVKALDHVLRQHILLAAVQGEVSPKELTKALDEGLSQVSYHVNVLRDDCDGMLERTAPSLAAGQSSTTIAPAPRRCCPRRRGGGSKKGLRAVVGAGQASDLFNDLAEALKAGKLQGAHDHIVRIPLALDAEGKRNVKAIARRTIEKIENEQRAAAERMAKENGEGSEVTGHTFALLTFEAAWEPADLRASVAQTETKVR
jgi:hypothetical protein